MAEEVNMHSTRSVKVIVRNGHKNTQKGDASEAEHIFDTSLYVNANIQCKHDYPDAFYNPRDWVCRLKEIIEGAE